jgi:hypothetical protein
MLQAFAAFVGHTTTVVADVIRCKLHCSNCKRPGRRTDSNCYVYANGVDSHTLMATRKLGALAEYKHVVMEE